MKFANTFTSLVYPRSVRQNNYPESLEKYTYLWLEKNPFKVAWLNMSITGLYRVFIGLLVLLLRWLLSYNKTDCGIFGIFPDVERLRIESYALDHFFNARIHVRSYMLHKMSI